LLTWSAAHPDIYRLRLGQSHLLDDRDDVGSVSVRKTEDNIQTYPLKTI
jgi:hypothetical protein